MFCDRPWKLQYSTDQDNPLLDFYIPALTEAQKYDRKLGFFNSRILSQVARGLGAILEQNGQIRLLLGCQFNEVDIRAIEEGYELRERMLGCLSQQLTPPKTLSQLKHFEILSWLIQIGCLDIKIAIPLLSGNLPDPRSPQLDKRHIFHEKVGIFTDIAGNQLVFSGSNNESLSGWDGNTESFHVFGSWLGDRDQERIAEEAYRFEELWNDLAQNVRSFPLPDAIRQQLLRYAPTTQPHWSLEDEGDRRSSRVTENSPQGYQTLDNRETLPPSQVREGVSALDPPASPDQIGQQLQNLPQSDTCLDFCLNSIPITPWAHQLKILRHVEQNFPCRLLIADEVGLGKTIEAGLILRYLLISQKARRILILAPASVQPQWHSELREKFNLHFWSYSQNQFTYSSPELAPWVSPHPEENPWNQHDLILASSHLVRRQERRRELLDAQAWDLVILDEAHHARRQTPQSRKDTPNSLLTLMRELAGNSQSLILLSATPMQIDPIEIFDLLNLLGLPGLWEYGDLFCDYFASLASLDPEEGTTARQLEVWQQLSRDYFQRGGFPCPQLSQKLRQGDRLLYYKLEDIWQKGKPLTQGKKLAQDTAFLKASRQYLTTHTPLKDLMFRHTRDTLRQYYRLGMLEQDVPIRIVCDNAIALEPQREIPLYSAVSQYVRDFYRLAQKKNRKALGFLMTLYRKRLTSSFYAIQQSLQRRLEGISFTEDDLLDIDDASDPILAGLDPYMEPVDPQEIEYLQDLLKQFEQTGEDSKLRHCLKTLREELNQRDSAIIFTQYTDTMDYLRGELKALYGSQIACYSGRGGELWSQSKQIWYKVAKEQIKQQFRDGEILILLCTESASEGLNLQTCGVLFNYDMPWNPMRVEQRIGRIDRIGQRYPEVRIHNFYYDGTVEAKVYRRLRDRIDLFSNVVGNLQPILAQVPTFLERVTMSADPQEEDVLMSEFENSFKTGKLSTSINDLAEENVQADLEIINKSFAKTSLNWHVLEGWMTQSNSEKIGFQDCGESVWLLRFHDKYYRVTFNPQTYDECPSLQLLSIGNPLFEQLCLAKEREIDQV